MKRLIYLILLCLPFTAQAQKPEKLHFVFGNHHTFYAGYDFAHFHHKDELLTFSKGFRAGYEYDINISNELPVYLGVGAGVFFYYQDNTNSIFLEEEEYSKVDEKNHHSFGGITIPVNFTYDLKIGKKWLFKPMFGIHVNYNLHAAEKLSLGYDDGSLYTIDYSLFDEELAGQRKFNHMFMGWQTGFRVQYGHLGLGFTYEREFMQISSFFTTNSQSVNLSYTF